MGAIFRADAEWRGAIVWSAATRRNAVGAGKGRNPAMIGDRQPPLAFAFPGEDSL